MYLTIQYPLQILFPNHTPNFFQPNFLVAAQSEDELIAGSINLLYDKGCTNDLFIFQEYYLQCTIYKDSYPGINWQLIVLLPAVLEVDHVETGSTVYIAVVIIAAVTMVVTVSAGLVTAALWRTRMMQLSQPIFSVAVLCGCFLLCVSCLLSLGPNTDTSCPARAYVFNLAFTLAFSPLLIRAWRVYSMFVRTWHANILFHGAQNKLISGHTLTLGIIAFLVLDVVIVSLSVYSYPRGAKPYTASALTTNGAYAELTYCGYHGNQTFFYTELCYKGSQIVLACYLVFTIRKVAEAVAGAKLLMAIVYNTAVVAIIVVALIRNTISDVALIVLCQTIGICCCVWFCSLSLTMPILYSVVVTGDKTAAADVIDVMFQARSNRPEVRRSIARRQYLVQIYIIYVYCRQDVRPSVRHSMAVEMRPPPPLNSGGRSSGRGGGVSTSEHPHRKSTAIVSPAHQATPSPSNDLFKLVALRKSEATKSSANRL